MVSSAFNRPWPNTRNPRLAIDPLSAAQSAAAAIASTSKKSKAAALWLRGVSSLTLSATFGNSNFRPHWKKCEAKVLVERYRLNQGHRREDAFELKGKARQGLLRALQSRRNHMPIYISRGRF